MAGITHVDVFGRLNKICHYKGPISPRLGRSLLSLLSSMFQSSFFDFDVLSYIVYYSELQPSNSNIALKMSAPDTVLKQTLAKATLYSTTFTILFVGWVVYQRNFSPLAGVPGPFWASVSRLWYLRRMVAQDMHRHTKALHFKYGMLQRFLWLAFDNLSRPSCKNRSRRGLLLRTGGNEDYLCCKLGVHQSLYLLPDGNKHG